MPKVNPKLSFEQVMQAMNMMSPEEREAKIAELAKMCICDGCPTYAGTGEKRLLFCITGKSEIIKKEKGCICPVCPVQENMALRWDYYCTRGSGKEQAGMK